jgi:hypothetical protein
MLSFHAGRACYTRRKGEGKMKTFLKNKEEVFEALRDFFTKSEASPEDRRDVWHVLSALRGPDESSAGLLKEATTAVIRNKLFGQDANFVSNVLGIDVYQDNNYRVEDRTKVNQGAPTHFQLHAINAFRALGLEWSKLNESPKEE